MAIGSGWPCPAQGKLCEEGGERCALPWRLQGAMPDARRRVGPTHGDGPLRPAQYTQFDARLSLSLSLGQSLSRGLGLGVAGTSHCRIHDPGKSPTPTR